MLAADWLRAVWAQFKRGIPVSNKSTDPPWLARARTYIGLREIKGPQHEPKVVELFKLSGFSGIKDDETAWCAAFVGGVLALSGIPDSDSLAARSYEKWGTALKEPVLGCVGVKRRAGGAAWQGHVGFVVAANATHVWLCGGNQSDKVSIARFQRAEFTAFRWPTGHAIPNPPVPLPQSIAGQTKSVSEA